MPLRVTLSFPHFHTPNYAKTCILPALVSCHCSVSPPHLAIGASMSYLWDSSWLFKDKEPLMVFTWEQVSKCQFQQFIFHVRIEMSHPSIMLTQSVRDRIYFSPCENICTSYVFIPVCVNERSASGQCQQLKRKTASLARPFILAENSKQVNWQIIPERSLDFASEQKWVNNVMNSQHNGNKMQMSSFLCCGIGVYWLNVLMSFEKGLEFINRHQVSSLFDWCCKTECLKPLDQLEPAKHIYH